MAVGGGGGAGPGSTPAPGPHRPAGRAPLPRSLRRPGGARPTPVASVGQEPRRRGEGSPGGVGSGGCAAALRGAVGVLPRPRMLRQRNGRLLSRLERVLQLLEFDGSVEEGGCEQPLGLEHPGTPVSAACGGWGRWWPPPPIPAGHPLVLPADYIRIARCFEATRQRCCHLEQDGRRVREQLARVEAERAALEVKLKHARNQVEVEMNKRHRAEAELEKQVGGEGGVGTRVTPQTWLWGPQPPHCCPVSLAGAQTSAGL